MKFLQEHGIYAFVDHFERKESVSIGFITELNPTIVNRDELRDGIIEIMEVLLETADEEITNAKQRR